MVDLTPIINAVICLIAAVISVFIIPKVNKCLKAKLSADELTQLEKTVEIAVQAAEQIYKNAPKSGKTKKDHVLTYLYDMGYNIDTQEVNNLIEAKVNELYGEWAEEL